MAAENGNGTNTEVTYDSLSAIYEDLNSSDFEQRLQALIYVGEHGWKGSLDYLVRMLDREDNNYVIATLIKVIGKQAQPKTIDFIRPYLSYTDSRIRANAVDALSHFDEERIFDIIAPHLSDPDKRVCANAVRAIWKFNPAKSLMKLEDLIRDDSASVRRSVLFVLDEIEDLRIRKIVKIALSDEDPEIKNKAEALEKKLVLKFAEDEETTAQPEDEFSQIVSQYYITNSKGKLESLKAIEKSGEQGFVKPLIDYLPHEENDFVVASIVLTLGKLGGSEVVPALREALSHENHRVRANAVEALSYTGDKQVFFYIADCFHDSDNRVQANVAKALWMLSPQQCLDKLRQMAVSSKQLDRLSAVYALSVIGTPMCKILLKDLTKDKDPKVAGNAREALGKIATGIELEEVGPGILQQLLASQYGKWLIPLTCLVLIATSFTLIYTRPELEESISDSWRLQVKRDSTHFIREQRVRQGKLTRKQFTRIKPYLKKALIFESRGKYNKAKTQYQKALKLADNCSLAHNNLGFIYFREGRLNLTKDHYEKALAINPKYVSTLNNYGFLMFKRGRIPVSKSYYEKALEIAPDDQIVMNNLGYTHYIEANFEKARELFETILDENPLNAVARNNLAAVLIAEKNYQRAATELEEVVLSADESDIMGQQAKQALETIKETVQ